MLLLHATVQMYGGTDLRASVDEDHTT